MTVEKILRCFSPWFAAALLLSACTLSRDNPYDPRSPDYSKLKPPKNFSAVPLSETRVKLTWADENEREDGYAVERRRGSETRWVTACVTGEDAALCVDSGLDTGALYYYRGFSFNAAFDTAWTPDIRSVATRQAVDSPVTGRPEDIRYYIDNHELLSISLMWSDTISNERGFVIEKRPKGAALFSAVDSVPADMTHFLDYGIETNTHHVYRVAAYNNSGLGPYSDTLDVFLGSPFRRDSNTVGLWYMEDLRNDSVMADSSGNGYDGRLERVLPISDGMFGNCYFLWKGDSSRITVNGLLFPDSEFVLEFYFRPSASLDTAGDSAGIVFVENGPVNVFYAGGFFQVHFYTTFNSIPDTIVYSEKMHFPANKWTLVTIVAGNTIKDVMINRLHKFYLYRENTPLRVNAGAVLCFGEARVNGRPVHFSGRLDEARLLKTMRYW